MSAAMETFATTDVEPIRTQLDSAIDALQHSSAHPDDPAFLAELRNAAQGHGLELPQLPDDLARVRLVLANPDAGPRDLAKAIRHNPVMAAQFISLASSAFFSGQRKIEHLEDAVIRVGMRQAVAWVMAIVAKSSLFVSVGYQRQASDIFQHSMATAINASLIANMSMPERSAEAFVAGLLHDFGRIYILSIAGGQDKSRSRDRGAPSPSMLTRANDQLHAGFSGLIARGWAFNEEIVSAILDHHTPIDVNKMTSDKFTMMRVLRAADEIGHRMIETTCPPKDLSEETADLLGAFDTLDELLEEARVAYESFESVLS